VKASRIPVLLSVLGLAMAGLGCGTTAPARFYALSSAAAEGGAAPLRDAVIVGPVSIPASVDRPQFVVQVAPNRVEVDEFNRWVSPLGDSISRTVAGDLSILLGTPDVATAPFANFSPVYRVTIDVQRFESLKGEAAIVEAVWAVRRTAGGETRSGRTVAREAVTGDDFEAMAAAHSRALAQLSGDIATAIRAEAGASR
jgi:uncharacterized lipoprotein YmbA